MPKDRSATTIVGLSVPEASRHSRPRLALAVILLVIPTLGACALRGQTPQQPLIQQLSGNDPCGVRQLKQSEIQGQRVYSPDGSRYLLVKKDDEGVSQVYFGMPGSSTIRCATCDQQPGGPKPERFKMQPRWHPSGDWFFLAVERDNYSPPPILGWSRPYVEGQLQNGIWTNMYAVSADGLRWHRLTDFRSGEQGVGDGFTGPAFTPDGQHAVWSEIVDGNVLNYWPFGRWELILGDFIVEDGIPRFTNKRNITPEGMHWNEPGNFHPQTSSFLFSGSDQKDAQGMDIYSLDITTHELVNLTKSPTVWDEHGSFSPDGEKVVFMSAYPYRDDPAASQALSIKTEFMLMNKDGGDLRQLTHFREPGYPEYSNEGGIAATAKWSPDGRSLSLGRLFFPDYEYWDVIFEGPCGRGPLLRDAPLRSRQSTR